VQSAKVEKELGIRNLGEKLKMKNAKGFTQKRKGFAPAFGGIFLNHEEVKDKKVHEGYVSLLRPNNHYITSRNTKGFGNLIGWQGGIPGSKTLQLKTRLKNKETCT
jgi:hypothetical protein